MSTTLPPRSAGPAAPNATNQLLDELDALMQRMLALPVNDLGEEFEEEVAAPNTPETEATTATATLPAPVADYPSLVPEESESEPPAAPHLIPEIFGSRQISAHPASSSLPSPHWTEMPAPAALPPEMPPPPEPRTDLPPRAEPRAEDLLVMTMPAAFSPAGIWPHPVLIGPERRPAPARPEMLPPLRPAAPPAPRLARALTRLTLTLQPLAGRWQDSLLWSNRTFDHWTFRLGRHGRWLQGRAGRKLLGWLGIGLLCGAAAWGLKDWLDWTW